MKRLLILAAGLAAISLPAQAQDGPDTVMGEKQFGQCRVCHTNTNGGADGVGPNLWAVFGSKAATRRTKYNYSPALKASGLVWDETTLDAWLTDPAAKVKGTNMHFIGIPRKPVRANIIAYLKTLK